LMGLMWLKEPQSALARREWKSIWESDVLANCSGSQAAIHDGTKQTQTNIQESQSRGDTKRST
jgi:hypothetical protein